MGLAQAMVHTLSVEPTLLYVTGSQGDNEDDIIFWDGVCGGGAV